VAETWKGKENQSKQNARKYFTCNNVSGDEGPWDIGSDFRPSSS
jgi:hypothetical protein